jgi:hypothetical protein
MRYVLIRADDLLELVTRADGLPRATLTRLLEAKAVTGTGDPNHFGVQPETGGETGNPGVGRNGMSRGIIV